MGGKKGTHSRSIRWTLYCFCNASQFSSAVVHLGTSIDRGHGYSSRNRTWINGLLSFGGVEDLLLLSAGRSVGPVGSGWAATVTVSDALRRISRISMLPELVVVAHK